MTADPSISLAAALGVGFILGLRHATEADHVVAVSTIVSRERSFVRSGWVGVLWGVGHTLTLLLAAAAIILMELVIADEVAALLELLVAVMIVVLGVRTLRGGGLGEVPVGAGPGAHASTGWKSLAVGSIHGLAGAAAIPLLIVSNLARRDALADALTWVLVFGAGSVIGMLLMSVVISIPFALSTWAATSRMLQLAVGAGSIIFGIYYGYAALAQDLV